MLDSKFIYFVGRVIQRMRWRLCMLFAAGCMAAHPTQASETKVQIYAAGSLGGAMQKLIAASGIDAGMFEKPVFGPAGSLRGRIEKGEAADLFFSANMAHPRALVDIGRGRMLVPFVKNRLCVLSKPALGVTTAKVLEKMLDPALRLGTSTPVSDPSGDYTWEMFSLAEAQVTGARDKLADKAMKLFGSPDSAPPLPGKTAAGSLFLSDQADLLVVYCSSVADAQRDLPLNSTLLPTALDVPVLYGLTLLSSKPSAFEFGLFVLSDRGQTILRQSGLIPVASGVDAVEVSK